MPLSEQSAGAMASGVGGAGSAAIADPALGGAELAAFAGASAWSRLSEADTNEAFAAAWLDLQCRLIGEVRLAVVVFGPSPEGTYAPLGYWPEGASGNASIAAVAELAMQQRRGAVRQRQVGPAGSTEGVDAVAYPLMVGDELHGAVAMEVAHAGDARLHLVMRLLQWGCAWWHRRLSPEGVSREEPTRVLEILVTALQEERYLAAATAVSTELATALDCERVSISFLKGRHAQVSALSHAAQFNRKSSLIRALTAAMDEAMDQQETLVLPQAEQGTPLVTQVHEHLMEQHGSKAVCTVPLGDAGRVVGAVTLERGDERRFTRDEVRLCEHAAILIGPVLEGKRRNDRWIGVKLWDSLRDFASDLLGSGHLGLKLGAIGALAVVLFFSLANGEYRITAPASLEGTIQRSVTAPLDGYISAAEVRAGDLVADGVLLAALEDKSLRLDKVQWEAEREKHQREYSKALAGGDRAQVRILDAQIEQADARIELLTEQLARTRIRAPFAGVVVSGDLSQSLGSPVSRGDVLFEIAPLNSYRVILEVDERDISQIEVGQTGRLALAGLPGEPLSLTVEKVTPVATSQGGRNMFRVEAVLHGGAKALRPGMKGVAKIDVDERKLFWIWSHKLVYWLELWWWSWWP